MSLAVGLNTSDFAGLGEHQSMDHWQIALG